MSRTTASDGSWTLIHFAQATYMTTPTVIMHMHICPPAVVPGVALPSTEDYLCCNVALGGKAVSAVVTFCLRSAAMARSNLIH